MNETPGQKFTVSHNSPLLEYLYEIFPSQSKTGVKACLRDERVILNGKTVTAFDQPLWAGDSLTVLPKGVAKANVVRETSKEETREAGVRIVYEDDWIIVVDKDSGIPVVSQDRRQIVPDLSRKGPKGQGAMVKARRPEISVYNVLSDYIKQNGRALKMAHMGQDEWRPWRIWIVHRLDRDTSGLLVFAKDEETRTAMQSSWDTSVYERGYTALLEGRPKPSSGKVVSYLKENDKSFIVTSSKTDDGGKKSITNYKVIKDLGDYSLVEFSLETGRKNQIRVHAATDLGCPVAGDRKYGASTNPIGRLALHAGKLSFRHPKTGEKMEFTSGLPKAFTRFIAKYDTK
jgi:23S rRNA pseudouridine1911/1915/1917 synthase